MFGKNQAWGDVYQLSSQQAKLQRQCLTPKLHAEPMSGYFMATCS